MINETHNAFDSGKTTPLELTKQFFTQIKASKHNAFITLCENRALKQAETLPQDLKLKHGGKVPRTAMPLYGIPLGIKDILTMDGVLTTCGSKMLANYIPHY